MHRKKEIKKAEKANKSNEYAEAMTYLNEAEGMLSSADNELKAQFYAAKGEAYLGSAGDNSEKLKTAGESFQKAISFDANLEAQLSSSLQAIRAKLINSAIKDQNGEQYTLAADKLYLSYTISKDPSDLYFAAGNMVNAKSYDEAIKYYQMLLDQDYTGETSEFVATNKETGEVESFDNENLRNIAVKSGRIY